MKNVCVLRAPSPISAPLSEMSVGKGLGRSTAAIPSYKGKNWAAASVQGMVEVSVDDVTHQLRWQTQLFILQSV